LRISAGVLNPGVLILDEELPAESQPIEDCRLPIGQENAMPLYCGDIVTVPLEAEHD
jgi:hypothetical protein